MFSSVSIENVGQILIYRKRDGGTDSDACVKGPEAAKRHRILKAQISRFNHISAHYRRPDVEWWRRWREWLGGASPKRRGAAN